VSAGRRSPVLIIAGPTASGKSRLAMDIATAFASVIINADSMQVYRELRVLTARPSAADEARLPHRLYGVRAAREPCSAGHWAALAAAEIKDALSAPRLPILVGGTGFYLKALIDGLAPIPPVPAEVRAAALSLHAELGGAAFREALAAVDPVTAARLPSGDTQRLVRAWEVAAATGRPLSDWHREAPQRLASGVRFATLVLDPPREALNHAIEARLEAMIAEGAISEVRNLLDLDLDPSLPAMKAVGVKELAAYVRGNCSLEAAAAAAAGATRRFAKRQRTWLRHRVAADIVVSEQYSERIRVKIFTFIRQFLLTAGS
jgi:tRNA dimethylallyltransferase